MAVYKRTYSAYSGALTPEWSRFLILPKASFSRLWQSRFLVIFYIACFIYPLGLIAYVYLANNLSFLESLGIPAGRLLTIDERVFLAYSWFQGGLAYFMTAFVGPSLISPDLVNNGLPLYLCRPFSRAEYVGGKMSVLLILLSSFTWVPGLIVFAIQCTLAGWDWTKEYMWIAGSLIAGEMVWITLLSLIALAASAWVRWRMAAGALILGVFFIGSGFGTAINSIMRTDAGTYINLLQLMYRVWIGFFGVENDTDVSFEGAAIALGVAAALCIFLLTRKVRAHEVIK